MKLCPAARNDDVKGLTFCTG